MPVYDGQPRAWACVMQPMIDALRRCGHAPDLLLQKFDLSETMLHEPYREIPLRNYVAAFEAAAVAVGDRNFGLLAARNVTPYTLGPVGLLFVSAPTIMAALKGFIDYIGLVQEQTSSELVYDGHTCIFRYRIDDPHIRRRRQDAEYSLALVTTLVRAIAGNGWCPIEVHFEHGAPDSRRAYDAFFGAPLYFDQGVNSLIFPKEDLAIRGNFIDRRLSPIVEHYLQLLRERAIPQRSIERHVRRLLSDPLPGGGSPKLTDVAHAVGVSRRTLQRKLNQSGECFAAIKQEKRRSLAESYLLETKLSVTEIAHILGYADGACFTRACQRWFGKTPSAVRHHARQAAMPVDGNHDTAK